MNQSESIELKAMADRIRDLLDVTTAPLPYEVTFNLNSIADDLESMADFGHE